MNKNKRNSIEMLRHVEKTCTESLLQLRKEMRCTESKYVGMLTEKGWGDLTIQWENDVGHFYFVTNTETNYQIEAFIELIQHIEERRKDSDMVFMDNILEICYSILILTNQIK